MKIESLLEKITEIPEKNTLQVNSIDGFNNYCIGLDSENRISFLISFSDLSSEDYISPYNGNNLYINFNFNGKVKVGKDLKKENFILLQLKNDEDNFLKIFLNICETIILKLGASPKYKNSRDYIFSLKDLFLKFNNQPTKTEIGLWGELATIYFSNNSESLIKSWHVSGKEIFDFNFEMLKIEVKTTKKTVRTHNLKHTQFIRLKKLKGVYLSYLLLETDNGKSCIELSDLILAELNSNTREMFIEKLIECVGNSLENFNHRFDLNYSEINLAAYSSEDIDYIEEKSLSSNISNINYDLNFEPFEKIKEQTNNDLFNLLPQLSH
ncbi:PD-(D/E)XK motif protein [Flavobacteriaceae bacterium]|nr:PD-(D/E)XK motif protein [Flavobacteriaceae bacterium]